MRLLTGLRLAEGIDEALLDRVALDEPHGTGPDSTGSGLRAGLVAVADRAAQFAGLRDRVARLCDEGRLERRDGRLVVPAGEIVVLERLLAELW